MGPAEVAAILFGVFPYQFPGGQPSVLKYMDATIDQQVDDLADWTRETEASNRAATASAEFKVPSSRFKVSVRGPATLNLER